MPASPRPTARPAWALVVAILLPGCFSGYGQPRNPFDPSQGARESVQVRVDNQNFNDVTLYALRGGEPIRMGDVIGKSSGSFDLDWSFSLPLEFRAELVGGGGCRIRPLSVDPGDRVWVRIPVQMGVTPCQSGK